MPSTNPRTRVLAARAGAFSHRPGGIPDDLKRELLTARIEDYVRKVVDGAPPLTAEQRDRIAALLRPDRGAQR